MDVTSGRAWLMPFLRAGFNHRNRDTGIRGWTRPASGGRFMPAELRCFACGDFFWIDARAKPRFLAWGESCVLGSWYEFDLPWEYQRHLPACDLVTRAEAEVWPWVEERRRKLERGEPVDD